MYINHKLHLYKTFSWFFCAEKIILLQFNRSININLIFICYAKSRWDGQIDQLNNTITWRCKQMKPSDNAGKRKGGA